MERKVQYKDEMVLFNVQRYKIKAIYAIFYKNHYKNII